MSKKITINAEAPAKITFTNVFGTAEAKTNEALAELQFPLEDDDLWNTGLAVVGDPHIDEIAVGQKMANGGNAGLVKDRNGWKAEHIVAIRLFHTNSFVYLLPGDVLEITTKDAEAIVYYAMIHDDNLKVETEAIEAGDDREEDKAEFIYLSRTTGIGDFDDEVDPQYPFHFDTEAATKGELISADEESEDGGEEGEEGEGEGADTETIPSGVDEGEG